MKKSTVQTFFDELPPKERMLAETLFEEISFMAKTLGKLKKLINDNGAVDSGANKESGTIRAYNQTVKNYGNLLKQLEKLLERNNKYEQGENALQAFLEAKK